MCPSFFQVSGFVEYAMPSTRNSIVDSWIGYLVALGCLLRSSTFFFVVPCSCSGTFHVD